MKERLRLLHLEDDSRDAELIHAVLEEDGVVCDIVRIKSQTEFERAVAQGNFDLILSDSALPQYDAQSALAWVRRIRPEIPFILVSGKMPEESAAESLKIGATDYVLKSKLVRLGPAVRRAVNEAKIIAERKRVEELFQKILENLEDLISVVDLDGKRIFCSPSYRYVLADPKTLIGTDALDEIVAEDRDRIRRVFMQTSSTGQAQRAEYRMVGSDGVIRHMECQASVMRDDEHRIANLLLVSRDITQRKEAEERILEQAALLDKAQDAICLNDLSQHILYWNKSAERLYGWSAEEALGRNANELLLPGDLEHPLKALRELIRRGEWQGELYQADRQGRELIVESRWTLMRDKRGQPKSILVINTDVTEKRQTEAKFLRTQRMESIGALAGGIAHDLNNALGPVLMAADILENEAMSPMGREMLKTMRSSAQRGAEMVKQILSFARGVGGEHKNLEIRNLVADMETFVRSTFPRSIRIETRLQRDLAPVMGDATQIHQVLLNLYVNARDAMPDGGLLVIEAADVAAENLPDGAQVTGPHIVISVTDSGHGISPEAISKIFEPFFTTKEVGKGTGLGLSTVLSIVKTHLGFVKVSSEHGKGATFKVYLPAAKKSMQAVVEPPPSIVPVPRGGLILVVDDDIGVLELTRLNLEAYDFSVLTANDGVAAIALYEEHQEIIKAVLTDMQMPSVDGMDLISKLREINPSVKIIGIGGQQPDNDEAKAARPFLQGYLAKPYSRESLIRLLQACLAESSTASNVS
jgi:PAS domain S-box-containing protein